MTTIYYKTKDGKYMPEIPKGKYGMQFSSYKTMRKAFKSTYKLKKKSKLKVDEK